MVFAISCNDDDNAKEVHDPDKPITLTSFFPDSGRLSEMIIFDGDNFGSDPSLIKMFFNAKEARVIGSTGKRMMALVPRLPGDTCEIKVQIGNKEATFGDNFFRYLIAASVTTLAGNGTGDFSLGDGVLDKATFTPVYIGIDQDFNIFVSISNNNLVRINEAENSISVVATSDQGYTHRCTPYANPVTNVLQMGSESLR
ncbi:MAG: IPT/TIG domain-containing protein, partial [Bacteroidales bacterium]|nr:IPT/TIG domain-containing protein [Bacteroidales bacterium]